MHKSLGLNVQSDTTTRIALEDALELYKRKHAKKEKPQQKKRRFRPAVVIGAALLVFLVIAIVALCFSHYA